MKQMLFDGSIGVLLMRNKKEMQNKEQDTTANKKDRMYIFSK
jgi:hypothetical protein